jgi:DNA-binding NarL/FixJ family response regulator
MDILLVEDHAVVRAGLRQMLLTIMGVACREADCAEAALTAIADKHPDLVLLDLGLPGLGGLALLPQLKTLGLRVLVLSMNTDLIYARHALEAGALGYVSKNVTPDELLAAIRAVAAGKNYVEHRMAQELAVARIENGDRMLKLTERDIEIMRLLAAGRSITEIGALLGISYKTVANTTGHIRTKLGVARTADLIRLAVEMQGQRATL